MKKRSVMWVILCLLLALTFFPKAALGAEAGEDADMSVTNGSHSIEAQSSLLGNKQLIENAESVILYDIASDTMIYSWNPDQQINPGSFTKIMTLWIVAEEGKLSDVVEVSGEVIATISKDAVSMDLKASEILTMEDLVYGMMVGSANDAAAVIADHMAGSQAAFADKMNQYAQKAGCTNTNFVNAHGLQAENQYTTPRDVTRIIAAASKNEVFREIFGEVYYRMEDEQGNATRVMNTSNKLLDAESVYYDSRIIGSRTSASSDGKRSVASLAAEGNLEVVSIITGSANQYEADGYTERTPGAYPETKQLLDLGLTGYKRVQVIYEGQIFKQVPVVNGDSDVLLGSTIAVSTVLPQAVSDGQLTYRYLDVSDQITAPVEKGQVLSKVQIWYQDVCLAEAQLCAMNAVPVMQNKIVHTQEESLTSTLKYVIPVLIAVILLVVIIRSGVLGAIYRRIRRKIRGVSAQKRSRRNRMNRRRSR